MKSLQASTGIGSRNTAVMSEILIAHEPYVRLAVFAGIFALMAAWEVLAPCRRRGLGRQRRWPGNLGIVALDALLVRTVFPTTAVGVAMAVEGANWGMLNVLGVSKWFAVAGAIVALDLAI